MRLRLVPQNTSFDFFRFRKVTMGASIILVLASIALWLVVGLILLGLELLMTFMFFLWLGVSALVPVAIYPFMNRVTWWPQVFLGVAFNWGALMGWVAHTGELGLAPVVLYLGGIAWTLHYDTIYAHQDKEDDALIGVKSTARLFGDRTKPILRGFLVRSLLDLARML